MMNRLLKALLTSLWFVVLCAPIMGIHINPDHSVTFRWHRLVGLAIGVFFAALLWHWYYDRKALGEKIFSLPKHTTESFSRIFHNTTFRRTSLILIAAFMICMPFLPVLGTGYQVSIMISGLIYVMLALGLNIIVGFAGQLVLGYAAFYGIGAYTYGLLHLYFGLGFWICLPIAGIITTICGLGLGLPVLRLRGDYLAIVTLGFGEIVRLVLLNWTSVTGGSRGVSGIPRPEFFGVEMDLTQKTTYLYYLSLIAVAITIIVITRLKNSRVGMALQAMREDEIASEAMGINLTQVKLTAFALSSAWAGFAGVLFAAKTQFINPASFTFMDSCMILAMVVLGGMGSILGVTIGALILILVPEYLRAFSDYRMLLFGATMVVMMLFRPQGIITGEKRHYRINALHNKEERA